ncbi:hypothetical protein GCM10011529_16700 [Polymorphobacter glacialis]|uniref:Uncharacterized protein n=1 Tax=Sandarakinorhabdus glacialis TaxID=1614636 RepID=A0A916ZTM9_9SPHN|nr:hypothetical protein [Polymorphobacter glacialis]GGE11003.1 hypothetical protein GCM10011529_16700 [Polymorphobacter glacialis]
MNIIMTIAAAALLATGAGAQVSGPAAPATESMQPAPPMDSTTPVDAAPAGAAIETLVQHDGKWWNGDRKATKAEISEYKKAKKAGSPG